MYRPPLTPFAFRDALVLVTGAGSGIGRASAERFARDGARLVLCDVNDVNLSAVRASLGPACVMAERVDVSDREQMRDFAVRVHAAFGALDVLVNNAGVGISGGVLETPLDDWEWVWRINVMGVVHGVHFFVPPMVARGRGAVVNVSSILGYFPAALVPAYVASKHAVLGLTESMRGELRPAGLRVCAVCPGMIDTAIIANTRFPGVTSPENVRARTANTFKRRGYPPSRVADAIVDAIVKDVAVLPVSPEAWAMRYATRYAPGAVELLGRLTTRFTTGR